MCALVFSSSWTVGERLLNSTTYFRKANGQLNKMDLLVFVSSEVHWYQKRFDQPCVNLICKGRIQFKILVVFATKMGVWGGGVRPTTNSFVIF